MNFKEAQWLMVKTELVDQKFGRSRSKHCVRESAPALAPAPANLVFWKHANRLIDTTSFGR